MKILAFSGSNSSKSINQQLINCVVKYINQSEVEVISLRDYEAPIYSIDKEVGDGFPVEMKLLKQKMLEADAFLISTPEHNSNIPAVLKNTIDWLSRMGDKVFQNKPTIFLSTSPGKRGGISALTYLVENMPRHGAQVIGSHAVSSFNEKVTDGKLINSEDETAIRKLLSEW